MIRADGAVVRLGHRTILDGVDLTARDGEVLGIVGPNGSGKSTLLRALLGVHPLAEGAVTIDDRSVARMRRAEIARRAVFVGQLLDPDPSLRVSDEVALGGIARHGSWRAQGRFFEGRVAEALRLVGLSDRGDDLLANLSGGERQRVAIARAIAHEAPHALLDEPTNHLDLRHRLELMEILRTIAPTVVVVLHDLDLAARACDRIVLLDRGRVVAQGAPEEVLTPSWLDPVYGIRTSRSHSASGILQLSFDLPLPDPPDHHP